MPLLKINLLRNPEAFHARCIKVAKAVHRNCMDQKINLAADIQRLTIFAIQVEAERFSKENGGCPNQGMQGTFIFHPKYLQHVGVDTIWREKSKIPGISAGRAKKSRFVRRI